MKKVVVIGGGFAGSTIAKALEHDFDVTLVDSKEYFEYTPGILRTLVDLKHAKKIQVLHCHYLKKIAIVTGIVNDITAKEVFVGHKNIPYNYLAICSGSTYDLPIKDQNVVIAARADHLKSYHEKLITAKKILIIGGGLVGVELAAEICTHFYDKEITIVHAGSSLIERNPEKARRYTEKFLTTRKVKILFNELVIGEKNNIFITDKKNKLTADLAFLCTGIKPNSGFLRKHFSHCLDGKGYMKVNKFLELENFEHIFVAGDSNNAPVEKTAQNAIVQAQTVVKNIYALENQKQLTEYKHQVTPLVISLGKYSGIFAWKNFVWTGFIPGILKTIIEIREMWKYT